MDEQERFYRIHSGKGLYYGLAKDERYLYVACRGTTVGPADSATRANESGSILIFDIHTLALTGELRPANFLLRDVHGAACINGKLFVACSHDNLIAVYEIATGRWEKWYPSVDVQARDRDVNHFNTIAVRDNRIVLLAHNNGPSNLLFYDPVSLDLGKAIQLGHQAHDIFCVGDELAVCSSAEGLIVSTTGWTLRTGEFPRGVDLAGGSNLIGISPLAERVSRHRMSSVLRRFDPAWTYTCDYLLEGVGMVLDILSIDIDGLSLTGLDRFSSVRRFGGVYNDVAPGNSYFPGSASAYNTVFGPEWHGPEGAHRWTAALEARMAIVANPGESAITVSALSGFPGPYQTDLYIGQKQIGRMDWTQSGNLTATFPLPAPRGALDLRFQVTHLWKPSECSSGSDDHRKLGIGIFTVKLQ